MKINHIFTILIAILAYNCSTPYQPKGALGGYSSNQLKENNFKVSFKGNQHTTAETVFDYLLRRCAEITIEENGKYFIVYEDSSYLNKIVFEDKPSLDAKIEKSEQKVDGYLLDRQPEINRDPLQTLYDQKTRIRRTYGSYSNAGSGEIYSKVFIDPKITDVVGVYNIQIFEELIEGFEDYFFSAVDILEKYNVE